MQKFLILSSKAQPNVAAPTKPESNRDQGRQNVRSQLHARLASQSRNDLEIRVPPIG